jgi:hypothetical protein
MSTTELKSLATIIRAGWKSLATEDQSDADTMVEVVKELLESLEKLEAGE